MFGEKKTRSLDRTGQPKLWTHFPEILVSKAGTQSLNVSAVLNYEASEQEGISSKAFEVNHALKNKTALKPFLMQ